VTALEAYLDNSATTKPCPEAVAAVYEALELLWGNPSSQHRVGLAAEELLENARSSVANKLNCSPSEVTFTSGGTEANNLALFGASYAQRRRGSRIVTSVVEHSSIAESAKELANRGFDVVYLEVDRNGRVNEDELARLINRDTILVSLMAVNNEVGTLQPIDAVRRAVQAVHAPALIHCDCVQAFGKLPTFPNRLGVDLITVSSHKIHGPKGAGALYIREGVQLQPLVYGGSQEGKIRPGTEPIPAIAGFGAAAKALPNPAQSLEHAATLHEKLLMGLTSIPGIKINSPANALPYLTNFSVPGLQSETMLNFLADRGISVSSGSACSKGKKSRVLRAMGLSNTDIAGALRVSFSRYTTPEEIDALLSALWQATQTLARS
jgi:cysteine desulfurase